MIPLLFLSDGVMSSKWNGRAIGHHPQLRMTSRRWLSLAPVDKSKVAWFQRGNNTMKRDERNRRLDEILIG
jgi:hypothetical protein